MLFWILLLVGVGGLSGVLYLYFKPGKIAETVSKAAVQSTGFFAKPGSPSESKSRTKMADSVWGDARLKALKDARSTERQAEIDRESAALMDLFQNHQDDEFLAKILGLIAANPDVIEYKAMLADLYLDQGELEKAEEVLSAMKALAPESDFVKRMLGGVQYEQGKLAEAKENLNAALEINPGAEDALYGKIAIGDAEGSLPTAMKEIGDMVAAGKKHPNLYRVYSDVLDSQWDRQKSRAIVEQGLREFPNDRGLLVKAGDQAAQAADFESAVRQWEKAYEMDSKDPMLRERLVSAWMRTGQKEKAIALLKDAQKDSPDDPRLSIQLKILEGRGMDDPGLDP